MTLTRNDIGKTPEVNEKNDDYCVHQFNLSGQRKDKSVKANHVFPNTDLAMLPPSIIEIEDEINAVNNEVLEEQ